MPKGHLKKNRYKTKRITPNEDCRENGYGAKMSTTVEEEKRGYGVNGRIRKRKVKPSKRMVRESISMGMLAIPGVFLLILFHYIPMFGIVIAFKDFKPLKGIWGSPWVGLNNFKFFFTSQDAYRTIRNTMGYNIFWLFLGTFCSVGLALLFYHLKSRKALKFYNTVILIPKFLSAVILAFLAEVFLHYRFGLINQMLAAFGSDPVDWYKTVGAWPIILTIVKVWGSVGVSSMIYYASLMGLDSGLLEAARMDGATKPKQIIHVMIPHLIPTIIIQNILSIGYLFTGDFGLFYQVPKDQGALYAATDIINTYTYRALQGGSLSRSAAVGLVQSAAGFVTVVAANRIVKKISPENSLF